ncbi:MAG TPA: P-II family nitrogen regulator [Nitrospiria bacterium]|nr:P-II family nitrogen regulator [Nitrospiria bacterium]
MKMIQAVVRPEREAEVVETLEKSGIHPFTRHDVFGRGRQKGLVAGSFRYEELPKVWLMVVVKDEEVGRALEAIKVAARTGNPGDGKLFVSTLTEVRTVRLRSNGSSASPNTSAA